MRLSILISCLLLLNCTNQKFQLAVDEYKKKSTSKYINSLNLLNNIETSSWYYKRNKNEIEGFKKRIIADYRTYQHKNILNKYKDTWIIYIKNGSMFISKLDGSDGILLLDKEDLGYVKLVKWSPDGKYIGVLCEYRSQKKVIFLSIQHKDLTKKQKVIQIAAQLDIEDLRIDYFSWAPNSKKIIYDNNGEIFIFNIKKTKQYRIIPESKKQYEFLRKGEAFANIGLPLFLKNSQDVLFWWKAKVGIYKYKAKAINLFIDKEFKYIKIKGRTYLGKGLNIPDPEKWNSGPILEKAVLSHSGRYFASGAFPGMVVCDLHEKKIWDLNTFNTPSWSYDDQYLLVKNMGEISEDIKEKDGIYILSLHPDPVKSDIQFFVVEAEQASWSPSLKYLKLPKQQGDESLYSQQHEE